MPTDDTPRNTAQDTADPVLRDEVESLQHWLDLMG